MIYHLNSKLEVLLKIRSILNSQRPIIISGGNTIKGILKINKDKIKNKKVLLSDERLVKINSKLRNDLFFKKLVKQNILNSNQLINYKYEKFDEKKIQDMINEIKKIEFYYAILSLGSNGHFASIFNFNNEKADYYFINNSYKFPKKRVTISLNKISKCKKIIFIGSRKNKINEIKNFNRNNLLKGLDKKRISLFTY